MKSRRASILALVLAAMALGIWWTTAPPGSAVDWSDHPAVILESDDWGLRAWMPDSTTAAALLPLLRAWGYGSSPYLSSTLEYAEDLDRIADVLSGVRGGDGRPALLQANTIVASPDYDLIEATGFTDLVLRTLAHDLPGWERPGLLDAIRRARDRGVWCPEYHGLTHLNGEAWLRLLGEGDPETRETFRHRVLLNDEVADEYECDPALPLSRRRAWLEQGLDAFQQIFGRGARSVIAPDYHWDASSEDLWSQAGLEVVQGWRRQVVDGEGIGRLERQWRRLSRPMGAYDRGRDLLYLYRNVFLEPAESPERPPAEIARESLRAVEHAWRRGRPAVVCTHRMNYVRLDRAESAHGLRTLRAFLEAVVRAEPRVVFLSDHELRQLHLDGVSQERIAPLEIRLRNYTEGPRALTLDLPPGTELIEVTEALGGGALPFRVEAGRPRLTLRPGDYTARLREGA